MVRMKAEGCDQHQLLYRVCDHFVSACCPSAHRTSQLTPLLLLCPSCPRPPHRSSLPWPCFLESSVVAKCWTFGALAHFSLLCERPPAKPSVCRPLSQQSMLVYQILAHRSSNLLTLAPCRLMFTRCRSPIALNDSRPAQIQAIVYCHCGLHLITFFLWWTMIKWCVNACRGLCSRRF